MADHMREQAAAAILTATTGLTTTGANVFRGRVAPFERTELPAGNVSTLGENVNPRTFPRPRMQERRMQVDWVAHVRKVDGYETQLNTIFKEVEIALSAPAVVAAFGAKAISLLHIDAPVEVQNEVTYVQAAMNFEVWYITAEDAPDVPR
jgi:hypothetical protein